MSLEGKLSGCALQQIPAVGTSVIRGIASPSVGASPFGQFGHSTLFNRDSKGIPENRREPVLPGMTEEERVSAWRHALLARQSTKSRPASLRGLSSGSRL